MRRVKAGERCLTEIHAAAHKLHDRFTDKGQGAGDLGADAGGPEAFLVPRQQIASKAKCQRQKQQQCASKPVEFARLFVCAKEVRPQHVEGDEYHHGAGAVMVYAAHHPAEWQLVRDVIHAVISALGAGVVDERQQDASDDLQRKRDQRQPTQGVKQVTMYILRNGIIEKISYRSADAGALVDPLQDCVHRCPVNRSDLRHERTAVDFRFQAAQRPRRRSAHDRAVTGEYALMTRALKVTAGLVPHHYAAQVWAGSIQHGVVGAIIAIGIERARLVHFAPCIFRLERVGHTVH